LMLNERRERKSRIYTQKKRPDDENNITQWTILLFQSAPTEGYG